MRSAHRCAKYLFIDFFETDKIAQEYLDYLGEQVGALTAEKKAHLEQMARAKGAAAKLKAKVRATAR